MGAGEGQTKAGSTGAGGGSSSSWADTVMGPPNSHGVLLVWPGMCASLGTPVERTSPARQAVNNSSSAPSLPEGAGSPAMTLLSKWKISVPGFQQGLRELAQGTSLRKSRIKW